MHTKIAIDSSLLIEALAVFGITGKKETVEVALKVLIKFKRQNSIRDLRGKLRWENELDES